jgi:hypothetical protein
MRRRLVAVFVVALGCSPTTAGGGSAGSGGAGGGGTSSGGAAGGGAGGSSATGGGAGEGSGGGAGTGGVASAGGTGGAGAGGAGGSGVGDASATGGMTGTADAAPPGRPSQPTGPGKMVLIAGGGSGGDGSPAVMASTNKPFGAVADPLSGEIFIAEYGSDKVRKIDGKGIISTVLGAGASGPGGKITLNQPHNLVFQPNTHNLFVGDTFATRVIRMDVTTGEATVFAGSGTQVAANVGRTYCLAFDESGEHLYVTGGGVTIIDVKTMAVSRINTSTPRVLAVDTKRNVYLGGGATLQVANPMGMISAVMGAVGLSAPKHLNVDLDDNVLIADTESDTIRRWNATSKMVSKLAGTGRTEKGTLDGPPEMAGLNRPHGVAVDAQGRILIADSFNDRVLRIDY